MLVSSVFARHVLGPRQETIARATGGTDEIQVRGRFAENDGRRLRINRAGLTLCQLFPVSPDRQPPRMVRSVPETVAWP
jgi:hypothetical protein